MNRKKVVLVAILLLSLLAVPLLFGGGKKEEPEKVVPEKEPEKAVVDKYGGTLNVALTDSLETLDCQKSVMHPVGRSLRFSVFEPLVRYVGGKEIYKPLLAKSWEFKDPTTLVMHLQRGVKCHDGTIFNSEDVKFTIERMQDPETACPNAAFVEMISEVVPVDDYTVQLNLSKPYGGVLTNLDYVGIISKESPPTEDSPGAGTGPYEFVEWIPGDRLKLKKFDEYWQEGLPYLDYIVFRPIPDEQTRLANLEADTIQVLPEITPEQVPRIEGNPDLKLFLGSPGTNSRVVIFITDNPPMDNLLVRKAIAHSMDRQSYVDSVYYGIGGVTENIYSPDNPYYNKDTETTHPFDLDRAKELFKEAGYPEDFPDEASPLIVSVPAGKAILEKAAVILQSSLRKIGIEFKIEKYDVPTWLNVRESKHMIITYYSYGGVDPSVTLSTNLISPKKNLPHYYDKEFEKLLDEGYSTVDFEARKEIYDRIQKKLIEEDVPFSIINCNPEVGAVRSYVEGMWYVPSWSLPIYHEVWLNTLNK